MWSMDVQWSKLSVFCLFLFIVFYKCTKSYCIIHIKYQRNFQTTLINLLLNISHKSLAIFVFACDLCRFHYSASPPLEFALSLTKPGRAVNNVKSPPFVSLNYAKMLQKKRCTYPRIPITFSPSPPQSTSDGYLSPSPYLPINPPHMSLILLCWLLSRFLVT